MAFVSLPRGLEHSFPQTSWKPTPPRIMFQFFAIPMLFRVQPLAPFLLNRDISTTSVSPQPFSFQGSEEGSVLNTFVVAASVTNASSPIQNLDEYVNVTLYHLTPTTVGPASDYKQTKKSSNF